MPNSGIGPDFHTDVRSYQKMAKPPLVTPLKIIVSPLWEEGARYVIEEPSKIEQFYQEISRNNSREKVQKTLEANYDIKYFNDIGGEVIPSLIPEYAHKGFYKKSHQEVFAHFAAYKTLEWENAPENREKELFEIASVFPKQQPTYSSNSSLK